MRAHVRHEPHTWGARGWSYTAGAPRRTPGLGRDRPASVVPWGLWTPEPPHLPSCSVSSSSPSAASCPSRPPPPRSQVFLALEAGTLRAGPPVVCCNTPGQVGREGEARGGRGGIPAQKQTEPNAKERGGGYAMTTGGHERVGGWGSGDGWVLQGKGPTMCLMLDLDGWTAGWVGGSVGGWAGMWGRERETRG